MKLLGAVVALLIAFALGRALYEYQEGDVDSQLAAAEAQLTAARAENEAALSATVTVLLANVDARPDGFRLHYSRPHDPDYVRDQRLIQEWGFLEAAIDGLNSILVLPEQVLIVLTECGEAEAYYLPESREVWMCHEVLKESRSIWEGFRPRPTEEAVNLGMSGVFAFLLYHEVGHALIDVLNLPITGREEDVADQLATYILVESGVERYAVQAGTFFANLPAEAPFWDEHSLGAQRSYNVMCWMYGYDPVGNSWIVDEGRLPEARAERCPREYEQLRTSWGGLLKPYRALVAE